MHHKREVGHSKSVSHLMLPLLQDEAHSVVKHALQKISETVRFLNPGQSPVVAADQPLFPLAKQIQ